MKVSIVGVGYVGLVAGSCLSDGGNHVICTDKDPSKIDTLLDGDIPIYEPGLKEIVDRNVKAGRLRFTTDIADAIANSLVIFLAVGTPSQADGSADMSAMVAAVKEIAEHMDGYRIVVTKSTVPVGTHKLITEAMSQHTSHPFDYVSNPEFLKEGAAVEDFLRPDRVIIGSNNPAVVEIMKQIYTPFMRKSERFLIMDPASAEMTKYAANALLATKISFINEVSMLCDKYGADVEKVRSGVGSDSRLGHAFLFPGVGYGGSCFPKDIQALIHMGESVGQPMTIVQVVDKVNQKQRRRFAEKVTDYFAGMDGQATLAVWGLSFKAKTDDIRESPAIDGIRYFTEQGLRVRAHDPVAMPTARAELGDTVEMFGDAYAALEGADGLVIFTDWQEFRNPDFELIKEKLVNPVIFDGRNLYNPEFIAAQGIEYHCVGRPVVKQAVRT